MSYEEPHWARYADAYRAIFEKLPLDLRSKIADCDKLEFAYDGDGDLSTLVFKRGATTLLTLTLGYDGGKRLISITRS